MNTYLVYGADLARSARRIELYYGCILGKNCGHFVCV